MEGWVEVAVVLFSTTLTMCYGGGGMSLPLERAFPRSHHGKKMSELSEFDRLRHGRMLQQSQSQSFANSGGVVDFQVTGDSSPFSYGLYYTKVQLGSPPKNFYVQIDTGSDVFWVSCVSCVGCPTSTLLQFCDPASSSTVSAISCADQRCHLAAQSSNSGCSASDHCTYILEYVEGTEISGVLLADQMHFDIVHGHTVSNSSAQITFGCSTSHTGNHTSARPLDGVIGFGQRGLSVISQFSSQGLAANVFSHCLIGSGKGGGILVLGKIEEPSIVYTPLVPSRPHYNVELQSISVNGQPLPIQQSVFSASDTREGTIIDSGTTLAYLPPEAYQPLVDKVNHMVSMHARSFVTNGDLRYEAASNLLDGFPKVELNFVGGASMVLKPEDYLVPIGFGDESNPLRCMGFKILEGSMTILGDLVLQDKIVVYDVANQQIGWADYDCSQPVNVLETTNTSRRRASKGNTASSQHVLCHWMTFIILVLLLQL